MDTILAILIGFTIFTFLYFLWMNWNQISLHIQILRTKFTWFSYVLFLVELGIATIIYYYVYPHYFEGEDLVVALLTTYTIMNFGALFLSWFYFNGTHCWRDEANGLAQKLYFLVGEDIGHFVMLIFRIIVNFFVARFLLTGQLILEEWGSGFKTILFFYSFNCGIFTIELLSNIVANFYGEVDICKNVHYLCKNYGVACDVPARLKNKFKK